MHRNIAPETKPCAIICTMPPATPSVVEDEEAERDEAHVRDRRIGDQLLHVLLHHRDQADVDHRDQRQRDHRTTPIRARRRARSACEKRRKP